MSIRAAIHHAVCAQLAAENKPEIELRGRLGASLGAAPDIVKGADYDEASARRFLAMVALRLRNDDPSLIFNWPEIKDNITIDTLWVIEERIAANTSYAKTAESMSEKAK
jgi:hypothetical protein